MIITFAGSTLGDDTSAEYISGFAIDQERMVDVQARMRATHVEPIGRENAVNTVRFRTNRLHSTEQAALEFLAEHPDSVPTAAGELMIKDNLSAEVKRFPVACCKSITEVAPDVETAGVTTCHAYEFVCGASADPEVD